MITYICLILTSFAPCFARNASFTWFVAMVLGLAIRTDKLGVTSIVRDLSLKPEAYTCLLHFFKADSWRLSEIRQCWYRAIRNFIPLLKETERFLLVVDGVKQSKEARRMPGVKSLHQESETQTKPDTIFGHMWGGVGVLAGVLGKMACIPASLRIHDGLQDAAEWEGSWLSAESHVVQMIRNCCEVAQVIGHSFALMDRYFLSVPALMTLREENKRKCCNDPLTDMIMGDLNKESLREIWHGEKYQTLRRKLLGGERRKEKGCQLCDVFGLYNFLPPYIKEDARNSFVYDISWRRNLSKIYIFDTISLSKLIAEELKRKNIPVQGYINIRDQKLKPQWISVTYRDNETRIVR